MCRKYSMIRDDTAKLLAALLPTKQMILGKLLVTQLPHPVWQRYHKDILKTQ